MPAFALTALRHWKLIGFGLLLLLCGVLYVQKDAAENKAERAKINLNECRKGREDDRKAYEDAQRKAAELNQAEVKRITDEQDRISSNVEADLTARLERLRSELRAKAAQGSAGSPKAGADVQGSPGTAGEAGVCLTPEELLQAATNEEKHDQLITLILEQLKVAR